MPSSALPDVGLDSLTLHSFFYIRSCLHRPPEAISVTSPSLSLFISPMDLANGSSEGSHRKEFSNKEVGGQQRSELSTDVIARVDHLLMLGRAVRCCPWRRWLDDICSVPQHPLCMLF